ncbi:MAG: acyl-CoA thioesterase/bile acid-CoA:amino acid N-acyltransferase family protein [Burkholderiales bacterium]|nr:acyl-CoA thioesterase/bile acid-CoA:amino acid N-acyltransferase family protein [Burkholderiales bacterium]
MNNSSAFPRFFHAATQAAGGVQQVTQLGLQWSFRWGIRALALAIVWAVISPSALAQRIVTTPAGKVLAGDPVAIKLEGFAPGTDVTIKAERPVVPWGAPPDKRGLYRAEATFKADAAGGVDLATAKPTAGSYKKPDVRGLFWSQAPVTGVQSNDIAADWKSSVVKFAAVVDGKVVAEASLELMPALPDVKTDKVEQFPGAVFANIRDGKKRPAIILLGGSEGGSMVTRGAAPLASHGFAVLALPYYSPAQWPSMKAELPELPSAFADIPVERLDEARAWLQKRATEVGDVDASRIAIHGTSKGAEYALLAGVHLGWPTAIVAIVPTDVVWEGWGQDSKGPVQPGTRSSFAYKGKPLPFVPYKDFQQEFMGFQTGEPVKIRRPQDNGRAANPAAAAAARIPVEKIKAPVLVLGGQDDQVWSSGMMAHNIAERRAEAKLETVTLIYPDAGHYLGTHGYGPTTQYDAGPSKSGGTPEGNARAQSDSWPKTIEFLKRTLGGEAGTSSGMPRAR